MGLFSSSSSKPTKLTKSESGHSTDSDSAPPGYSEAAAASHHGFAPTSQLQIQAIGYDVNQALTGRTLENITVWRPGASGAEYASMRLKKSSNSCALVRVSDPGRPIISTIYRFGPGRHPRMRILPSASVASVSIEDAIKDHNVRGELIEVKSRSMVSRGQVFDTSLGKFEWRFGTKQELAAAHADSLLVLERADHGGSRIAQLVRNDEYRTPGTQKYSGGNGGRLMMDLSKWTDDKNTSPERVEAFIVASCILMLKREADRFIDNHLAIVV